MKSRETCLVEAFEELKGRPFDWGDGNCALTAAKLVEAYSGVDYGAAYRARCGSALGSMRLLRKLGGLAGVLDELGFVEVPVAYAKRGDVLLYRFAHKGREVEALGVLIDTRAAFAGLEGMELVEAYLCESAWVLPVAAN